MMANLDRPDSPHARALTSRRIGAFHERLGRILVRSLLVPPTDGDPLPPADVSALLRPEGLDSSQLAAWRRQRNEFAKTGLKTRKRGPRRVPWTS